MSVLYCYQTEHTDAFSSCVKDIILSQISGFHFHLVSDCVKNPTISLHISKEAQVLPTH